MHLVGGKDAFSPSRRDDRGCSNAMGRARLGHYRMVHSHKSPRPVEPRTVRISWRYGGSCIRGRIFGAHRSACWRRLSCPSLRKAPWAAETRGRNGSDHADCMVKDRRDRTWDLARRYTCHGVRLRHGQRDPRFGDMDCRHVRCEHGDNRRAAHRTPTVRKCRLDLGLRGRGAIGSNRARRQRLGPYTSLNPCLCKPLAISQC